MKTEASIVIHEMTMVMANMTLVCHDPRSKTNKLIWYHGNPLKSPTALLLLQLSAISLVSQLIDVGLKPLGQSSIVSQIFVRFLFSSILKLIIYT